MSRASDDDRSVSEGADERYEHVIAGGGVYGTYVARELAAHGEDVLLVERSEIADGASGGPGKRGVRANGRDPRELRLMPRAYELWSELSDEFGDAIGYERTGHLRLVERETAELGPTSTASAEAQVSVQRAHGVATEYLDADAVRELEPRASDDVVGAVHCPEDGVVDQTAVTTALARAAASEGAEIRDGTAITGLVERGDRVAAVRLSDDATVAVGSTVSLLTNTHAHQFLRRSIGLELPVWNMAPQVILTEPHDQAVVNHLIGHAHRTLAIKRLPDGRTMITGGWPAATDGQEERIDTIPGNVDSNLEQAYAVFPALRELRVQEVVADHLEACSIDGVPVIDRAPERRNLLFATGWTGHGFAIAPAVAELLARWITTGDRPEPLAPFGIERFETPGRA